VAVTQQKLRTKEPEMNRGLEIIFYDAIWRIARCTGPKAVLRYDPRLADLGCPDNLGEASFFARNRWLWIVERHGVLVATIRCSDDEDEALFWKQPELIEIAQSATAWKALPLWVQKQIWQRLLSYMQGHEGVVHDRPEVGLLAVNVFKARVDRAIHERNQRLLEELAGDCPFWRMTRDELLKQEPHELRQWSRWLRIPKEASPEINTFGRSLRHAAEFIRATEDEENQ
jgi:hypothetical protein